MDLKKLYPKKWNQWYRKILKRDKCCQFPLPNGKKCGYRGRPLHPHHIIKKSDSIALAFHEKNGIILCWKHHMYIHKNRLELAYAPKFKEIIRENEKSS